ADGAVAAHDDFEHDVARHAALPGLFGVVRLHFMKHTWRLDAAPGTVRSAARAAARPRADAAAVAGSESRAGARTRAAPPARSVALSVRRRLFHDTDARPRVGRRRHDRRDERGQWFGVERRLGLRLRRLRNRFDWWWLAPQRNRTAQGVVPFAHGL